jgi:LCP family protein required for cell wall assembly
MPDFIKKGREAAEEKITALLPSKKKKKTPKIIIYTLIFLITGLAVFSSQVLVSNQSSTSWFANLPIIKQIRHLAESADRQLKGEDRDRINLLLLGMGGESHDGGLLTDTIMLVNIEPSTKKIAMISIPRDLSVPMEDLGWRKINNVNAYAEVETPGSGGLAVCQALGDILVTPIDYYARLDFAGFVNIIDKLGGVDINVDNTLDDYQYPVLGRETADDYESRYEHLHIEAGWQHMDGELALKYVRSRHAAGTEGSDFARARRQQKLLEAVKNKILSLNTLFNPAVITGIIGEIKNHFDTNLQIWEMLKLWELTGGANKENIINKVIDNGPNGLLVDTISDDGAYILVPRSGDFSELQYFVNNIFSDAPMDLKSRVAQDRATVEIRNGTWINGLASKTAMDLEKYDFIVIRIGNSSRQNFQKSMIYDLTYGEKRDSLAVLKNITGADVSFGLPEWLINDIDADVSQEKNPVQPDFILMLGQDADSSASGAENQEEETGDKN